MHGESISYGYAFWSLVVNVAIFVLRRLARREDREAEARFGLAYHVYAARVPMFVPRLTRRGRSPLDVVVRRA